MTREENRLTFAFCVFVTMKSGTYRMLAIGALAAVGLSDALAQGSLENLDFEQARIVYVYPSGSPEVVPSEALQHWNANAVVIYNAIALDSTAISLHDPNSDVLNRFVRILHGRYSVLFQDNQFIPTLWQRGTIPTWAKTLYFMTDSYFRNFAVGFETNQIPISLRGGTGHPYYLWAGDISSYAGQYGQLRFSGSGTLDFIMFSPYTMANPPLLSQPALRDEGSFEFKLHGETEQTYSIQHSTNLVDWISLTNVVGSTNPIRVLDTTATNAPTRFYRAVSP